MSKRRYEMPLGTKVEIMTEGFLGRKFNGKIGKSGAKDPGGLDAHMVYFNNGEFDIFMDNEFMPVQNILTIDNLDYETLCKVFDHNYIYDTDRILVKQKKFTYEEIETALEKYTTLLAKIFSKDADFGEEGICVDNRGKVLDLLQSMLNDNYDDCNSKIATAIEEEVMYEQWQIEGFRKHLIWSGKDKNAMRYFNPKSKIQTIFI